MKHLKRDYTNYKVNHLTILGNGEMKVNKGSANRTRWVTARCECGVIKEIRLCNILLGTTTSCGCVGRKNKIAACTKHGLTNHRLFWVHDAMKQRCYNPNHKHYKNWGGRGISVCDEWRNDFKVFYDWAITNGYKKGLDIDRINNDGNYEPSNCRFTTRSVNNSNRRILPGKRMVPVVCVESGEEFMSIAAAARSVNKNSTLFQRILRKGTQIDGKTYKQKKAA